MRRSGTRPADTAVVASLPTGVAGVRCGLSTRHGGVSRPPYATLNLGRSTADDPRAVAENRRRFALASRLDLDRAARMRQVHGSLVAIAHGPGVLGKADGLITTLPDLPLLVTVADCLPVFLIEPARGIIAALHAGWRGLVAGVIENAIERLGELGGDPRRARVLIGPSIGPCCFEVGEAVAARFEPGERRPGLPRPHVDLWASAHRRLTALGVPPDAIRATDLCTRCHAGRFFSARHGEPTGRQVGFIVREPRPRA